MQALILAGGSGTRFWPSSRRRRPKQLLALEGETSLLQDTVARLAPLIEPKDVWVCTTEALAEAVRGQLPEVPPEQVLAEPQGRNTAPAIGWSLASMAAAGRGGVVAVLPADHRVADRPAFRDSLALAATCARDDDRVMTLGVRPRWAETGYGYLELGDTLGDGVHRVDRFREKPEKALAEQYVEGGRHLWNAGIFVFRATTLLGHLERLEPELGRGLAEMAQAPDRTAEIYAALPARSIDFAVMERLDSIATVPLDCGWSDLGSWEALGEVLEADADGNCHRGDVMAFDSKDNLLVADEGSVAVLGVEGLVVVRTGDSVLVMPRSRSQDVRLIVDHLRATGRDDLL
ncbi:MAG: mannose-1-phosphate guanylyltransferase [Acidobacteriota bacterium]